jgi:hypothetical protein
MNRKQVVKRMISLRAEVEVLRSELLRMSDLMPWIPVSLQLPKNKIFVFIRRDNDIFVASRKKYWETNVGWFNEENCLIEGVTHWTPLNN